VCHAQSPGSAGGALRSWRKLIPVGGVSGILAAAGVAAGRSSPRVVLLITLSAVALVVPPAILGIILTRALVEIAFRKNRLPTFKTPSWQLGWTPAERDDEER
jgi:hypothetical protein